MYVCICSASYFLTAKDILVATALPNYAVVTRRSRDFKLHAQVLQVVGI